MSIDPSENAGGARTSLIEARDLKGKGKGSWYFIATFACPICGHEDVYRERRSGERPDSWEDRHEYVERWDYCNAL